MSRGGEGKRRRVDADKDKNRGQWFAGRYYRSTDGTDYQSRERGMFVVFGVDPGMWYDTEGAKPIDPVVAHEDREDNRPPTHAAQRRKRRADARLINEFGDASAEEWSNLVNGTENYS